MSLLSITYRYSDATSCQGSVWSLSNYDRYELNTYNILNDKQSSSVKGTVGYNKVGGKMSLLYVYRLSAHAVVLERSISMIVDRVT